MLILLEMNNNRTRVRQGKNKLLNIFSLLPVGYILEYFGCIDNYTVYSIYLYITIIISLMYTAMIAVFERWYRNNFNVNKAK